MKHIKGVNQMVIHSQTKPSKREVTLKKQLADYIDKYGELDPRTVKKSQQLDVVIVKRQKALMNI